MKMGIGIPGDVHHYTRGDHEDICIYMYIRDIYIYIQYIYMYMQYIYIYNMLCIYVCEAGVGAPGWPSFPLDLVPTKGAADVCRIQRRLG